MTLASDTIVRVCVLGFTVIYSLRIPRKPAEVIRFTILPPENTVFFGQPKISPDGRYVLSVITTPLGGKNLWLRSLSAVSGQVLAGTEGASHLFWSEDGRLALFWGSNNRLNKIDIAKAGPPESVPGPTPGFGAAWVGMAFS